MLNLVDGYKAFKGTMIIHTTVKGDISIKGDWLYKPETDCWYCKGSSYPASICEVDTDEI